MWRAPLSWFTLGWLAGIFGQELLPAIGFGWQFGVVALGGGLLTLFALTRRPYLPWLALLAFGLGALRLGATDPYRQQAELLSLLPQPEVILSGVISGEPTYSLYSENFRLKLTDRHTRENKSRPQPIEGEIYVRVSSKLNLLPGDIIKVTGKLEEPAPETSSGFPLRRWLAQQGIFTTLDYPFTEVVATGQEFFVSNWLRSLHDELTGIIYKFVPDEEGKLLAGILLGDKSSLSEQTRTNFTATGVAHLLAVSGGNIAIFASLLGLILSRFLPRTATLWLTLGLVLFYVLLVGATPAVLRAGLMSVLAVVGLLSGKPYAGLAGLFGSALLLTIWQPRLLFDIGFQLSALATFGLLVLGVPWQQKFTRIPPILREGLVTTLAAEIMVAPLVAYYFQQASLVSIVTNVAVLPAIVFIMAAGIALITTGFIFGGWLPFVAQVAGGLVWLLLAYVLATVNLLAQLPIASVSLPKFHPVWLAIYYFGLFGAIWWWQKGKLIIALK